MTYFLLSVVSNNHTLPLDINVSIIPTLPLDITLGPYPPSHMAWNGIFIPHTYAQRCPSFAKSQSEYSKQDFFKNGSGRNEDGRSKCRDRAL